jgi:hypothetical protein
VLRSLGAAHITNKHAQMIWAMLARDERYDADAWQRHPRASTSAVTTMPALGALGTA